MLAPVTHVLALTRIRRLRTLPVPGQVMVHTEQRVNPLDVIAQAPRPGSHMIVDVRRALNLRSTSEMEQVLQVHAGDKVEKDMPIAEVSGLFPRIVRAPADGTVVMIMGGRVILETAAEMFHVDAGISGVVTQVIPERGAWIETDGALVQGVWGNDQHEAGLLLSLLRSPEDTLEANRLDVSMRGGIIAGGHCSSADVLTLASELPLRGLILASMTADLVPVAENLAIPILVVEGFGRIPLNPAAYKILTSADQVEVCLMANRWKPFSGDRPEVIIPQNAPADFPLELIEFTPGQVVRVTTGRYAGRTGKLSEIHPEVQTFPSGVAALAADVQLDGGEEICVPAANLDVLE